MTPTERRAIAAKLRELAELIDYPLEQEFSLAPSLRDLPAPGSFYPPVQIGGCNCHRFLRGQTEEGWLCPVHGRQF